MHLALGMVPDNTNNVSYILWTRQIYKLPCTKYIIYKKKLKNNYPWIQQGSFLPALPFTRVHNPSHPRKKKKKLTYPSAQRLFLDSNPWPTGYQGTTLSPCQSKNCNISYCRDFFSHAFYGSLTQIHKTTPLIVFILPFYLCIGCGSIHIPAITM